MRLNSDEKKNIVDTRRERRSKAEIRVHRAAALGKARLPFARLFVTLAIRAKVSSLHRENREAGRGESRAAKHRWKRDRR